MDFKYYISIGRELSINNLVKEIEQSNLALTGRYTISEHALIFETTGEIDIKK